MIRKDNILSMQNPILKTLVCLILVIISSILNIDSFIIIFGFTLFYFLVSPKIYLIWLKTLLKIIPFFISIFIFGIIFNASFPNQCFLITRIIFLLLISVYLTETTTIDSIISSKTNQNSKLWWKLKFFLAATIHFIPILTDKFKHNFISNKNLINTIVVSMEECLINIHEVELTVTKKIHLKLESKKKSFGADTYLFLLLLVPVLVCFINL